MNGAGRIALLLTVGGVLALMFPAARTASAAVSEALAQCAAIPAADARLACYDTLAGRNADRPVSSVTGAGPAATPAPAAPAVYAPAPAPVTAPASAPPVSPAVATAPVAAPVAAATAAAVASSAPAPSPPAQDPRNFGYSAAQQQSPAQKAQVLQSIEAHVAQVPTDQLRATYVVLDNGQTWACTDGDMNLNVGEAVTIKRGALGSFMLTAASKHSYHVRRLR